jgi:hypothetical protein
MNEEEEILTYAQDAAREWMDIYVQCLLGNIDVITTPFK